MIKEATDDSERLRLQDFIRQAKAGIRHSSLDNNLYCQMNYWTDRRKVSGPVSSL